MNRLLLALSLASVVACSSEESSSVDDDGQVEPPANLAQGVHIQRVGLYQSIEVRLMDRGIALASTTPLITRRDALMRVSVSFDPGTANQPLMARLWLGDRVVSEVTATLASASSQESLSSTLNLPVLAADISENLSWHVEVLATDGPSDPDNRDARYPSTETAVLVTQAAVPLKILLLPLVYDADGSGRSPDLSVEQIELYRQRMLALYPVSEVDIEIGSEVSITAPLDAEGDGWDDLLDDLYALRANLGVADDVYVYGVVSPAASYDTYCIGDCTEGVSFFDEFADPSVRVGLGLGFAGEPSAMTMAHEIGHAHGRDHAPCDVFDSDPSFPYPDGSIGVWGYDSFSQRLYPPSTADMMSYCEPAWISDYHFVGVFERRQSVMFMSRRGPTYARQLWRVREDGSFERFQQVRLAPLRGTVRTVHGTLDGVATSLEGRFLHHSHGGGGILVTK